MATRTAKLRVELDGEKEYKQAISELNKGNQVLASEMRKLQAEYKGNEKSIEALNAKSDLLQRQMQQQADKVKTLREALANATKQYGEADKRTQEWQIQLNNAEAALINMGHQMQENNDLIEKSNSVLTQLDAAMETLQSDEDLLSAKMKALDAEYRKNANSTEYLTKKSALYKEQIAIAKEELFRMNDALEEASYQYGENSKEVRDLQIRIAETSAKMFDLENAAADANKALEKQDDIVEKEEPKMVSLGDAVDQVAGKLGVKLPEGARKALDGMNGLSAGSVAAMGAIAAAVAVVIKAVKELDALTLESAKKADDLLTQSMTSGISTDLLQQFQYAAPYIDVSAETMVGALKKIGLNAATAAEQVDKYNEAARKAAAQGKDYEGTLGAQAAAFERLGVSVRDSVTGELRDAYDVMQDALRALGEVQNQTERNALANDVFGKSYDELAPLIQNADEAQRLYNEALDNGFVLSEQQLEILGEVDDAHEKFTQTLEKQKDLIALQWAPTTKEGFEKLAELTEKAGKVLIDSKLVENFGLLVRTTVDLFEAGTDLFSSMPGWINPIEKVSNAMKGLAAILATVADLIDFVNGIAPWNWGSGKASTALGLNIGSGQMNNRQKLKYGSGDYAGWSYNPELGAWNAAGTDNWRGGLTWVGEAGPELVALPRGSQIYSNQESRDIGGGTNVYNITVANIQELDELLAWFESRRIRGRME